MVQTTAAEIGIATIIAIPIVTVILVTAAIMIPITNEGTMKEGIVMVRVFDAETTGTKAIAIQDRGTNLVIEMRGGETNHRVVEVMITQ